jgi:hypothetical protein
LLCFSSEILVTDAILVCTLLINDLNSVSKEDISKTKLFSWKIKRNRIAPITIVRTKVLMMEAITLLIPTDSRKLQKGSINEANRTPKIMGIKKGAPKYKTTTVNTANKRTLFTFVNLSIIKMFSSRQQI